MSEFDVSWQSTPALWMATRDGLCWCEDCRGKWPKGFGKTRDEAVAHLLVLEAESRD